MIMDKRLRQIAGAERARRWRVLLEDQELMSWFDGEEKGLIEMMLAAKSDDDRRLAAECVRVLRAFKAHMQRNVIEGDRAAIQMEKDREHAVS